MLPEIKNILYATDLSENAKFAYTHAAGMAQKYDARITILHVIEKLSANAFLQVEGIFGEAKWAELKKSRQGDLVESIKGRLSRFCDEINADMDACTFQVDKIIVKEGVPAEEILFQSDINDADAIVMGTHGYGMFKDALMGGTARRVVRRTTKPVFVVPLPET